MHIRIFRLNVRNPLIAAALLVALAGFVIAAFVLGLTLLAGAVAVGVVALVARSLLRLGRSEPPAVKPLDSSQEVFPPTKPRDGLPSERPSEK